MDEKKTESECKSDNGIDQTKIEEIQERIQSEISNNDQNPMNQPSLLYEVISRSTTIQSSQGSNQWDNVDDSYFNDPKYICKQIYV
ncbi:hypothetical protein TTHERM_000499609 (macronuclear) [Tetrahymena thermophila SB210]|uniref:Uncharacterized protein n=1 Tax=Tetrahymena thermophila (strain SB210) TaxID=312017 RepID=W7XHV5_TETTS|nr:hypothetical protein TTHERM_000499609 [Tetrahymena thermophila SB210]EWS72759.1 hypothetical protein TTHERM_000499609 [Tetrahymena thermophila SB210]|eukprot:XP_012654696.1 hypothetical protein TTHERM_000499609 [Tetrahymena thermophila SB210]